MSVTGHNVPLFVLLDGTWGAVVKVGISAEHGAKIGGVSVTHPCDRR
jgi:hypothetical protein